MIIEKRLVECKREENSCFAHSFVDSLSSNGIDIYSKKLPFEGCHLDFYETVGCQAISPYLVFLNADKNITFYAFFDNI